MIRTVVWVLSIASFALLFFGNMLVPEVTGVDFTPFELAGPPFFLVVIPATTLLARRLQHWRAAVVFPLLHALALTGFTGRFLGWRAMAIAVSVYAFAVLLAWYAARLRTVTEHAPDAG